MVIGYMREGECDMVVKRVNNEIKNNILQENS